MEILGSETRWPALWTAAEAEGDGDSKVAQFYRDRVVFITGGTGFIGKVLIEKLLRSCPDLKRVYLLIRAKRGEEPQERLATILGSQVFERLKRDQPFALEKVSAVSGDIMLPSLGLSASDWATLVKEVSVVFHSAAIVKFNEPLESAVQLNVLGTRRVLELCKRIPDFCAFVHVSTAYANCEKRREVHEIFYPPCGDIEKFIAAAQCTDDKSVSSAGEFLFGFPNTYTLTKRLAELLLRDECGATPVAIVRPSIVTASWKEPFPGWIDTFAACTSVIVSIGTGLLPSVMGKKDCIGDFIPVDIVVNMLICAAWHTAFTRFVQRYQKIRKNTDVLRYFTTHDWLFRSRNVKRLTADLSSKDKKLFSLDVQNIDWGPYWDQYVLGIRKYLFKSEDNKLADARRQLKWLYAAHLFLRLPFLFLLPRLLMTERARELGSSTSTMITRLCETLLDQRHE